MLLPLVSGIVALTFVPLGATFLVIGLGQSGSDATAFQTVGGAFLVAGLVLVAIAAAGRRRARHAAARRRAGGRAVATVVRAQLHPYTRIGVLLSYTLTVRFEPAGEVTRRLLVPPTLRLEPGGRLEVAYDRDDPASFEPLRALERAAVA